MFSEQNIMKKFIFITGGARSGKSTFAEQLLAEISPKAYIATANIGDDEMAERVRRHRERRGEAWDTFETEKNLNILLNNVDKKYQGLLIDCTTVYTSNLVLGGKSDGEILSEMDEIAGILKGLDVFAVVVSNEVGCGIVPDNALARRFRDVLGLANQKLAAMADEVYCVVSGIPMLIKK